MPETSQRTTDLTELELYLIRQALGRDLLVDLLSAPSGRTASVPNTEDHQ